MPQCRPIVAAFNKHLPYFFNEFAGFGTHSVNCIERSFVLGEYLSNIATFSIPRASLYT